jgi:hypothetical protein
MPSIYSFTNSDIDFFIFGGSIHTSPGTIGFDGTLIRTAINCSFLTTEGARLYLTEQNHGGAARSALRFQFAHVTNATSSGTAFASFSPGNWVVFKDVSSGRDVFRLGHKNTNNSSSTSTMYLQYNSNNTVGAATWVDVGAGVVVPATRSVHTITIVISDTVGVLTWHMNGALMASLAGGDTKFTSSTTIDCISLWGWGNTGVGAYTNYFAEFQLTDENFMTYGLTPVDVVQNANGTNQGQVSGVYTDVNDQVVNTGTAKTFDTAGQTSTDTHAGLPAALASSPIMAVRLASYVRRGSTGPQNMKHAIQQIAGLSLATIHAMNGVGFTTVADIFLVDPGTTLPWTFSGFNASEVGMQAAA